MSREIKFRCWGRYGYWDEEGEARQFMMIDGDDLCFEEFAPLCELLQDKEDVEYFMQFTGLKDKNGKDIYEGDIVKSPFFEDTNVPVIYDQSHCQFTFGGAEFNVEVKPEDVIVIGNIYENPNLINHE